MNRREAISALMSLPATAVITQARVEAEDTIVVECQEYLSNEMAGRIKAAMESVWPGRKVAILDNGMKLKIVRQTP